MKYVHPLSLVLLFNLIFSSIGFSETIIPLDKDWRFKNVKADQWNPAIVPGVVHLDLLDNGVIKDPYEGNNELAQRWIEFEDWEYSTTILADQKMLNQSHVELVFEGLDTYATILINGKEILVTDNMFREWSVELKPHLNLGNNELTVIFHSPLNLNKLNVEKSPYELPAANETVDLKVSPYTRKAAYHFGWDWGPRFVTSGIWRPVYLRTWSTLKVTDVTYSTTKINSNKGRIDFEFEILHDLDQIGTYSMRMADSTFMITLKEGINTIKQSVELNYFKEWNPIGYGNQWQWKGTYMISTNFTLLAKGNLKAAFREIELIHTPDDIGTSFYFKVNGEPFYAKGANYIPQDLFLPRVDSARYEKLIQQAVDANINMLRVWGGGIYENDYFYDLCDEKGILVWQDFMFANSMYPNDPSFMDNITQEVEYNVKRLRNHPCIALWCGNNEIEVAWENWGWQKQFGYSKKDSAEIWNTYTSIFHELIPQTLEKLSPNIDYVPTTPLSNWGKAENFNHSSMHYWGVWHGREPIENFAKNVGRFIAEYGYQSFPDYATLANVIDEADLNLESEVMKSRQKSYIGNGIIEKNVIKYAYKEENFEKWVELTQLVQAHAYGYAIRQHRIQTPHCMGTLFWQLNDCWPGPSWSVIDYYGNEKAAYAEVLKFYKPIIVSCEMNGQSLNTTVLSDRKRPTEVNLVITAENLKGMSAIVHDSEITLSYLQPQEFYLSIPKKLTPKFCKKKGLSHFTLTIKEGTSTIFESNYYPESNATVDFPTESMN
ncbi:MAG: beta-mannosidase [Crocinitomix sp.]|jgi:beta-mannosidase